MEISWIQAALLGLFACLSSMPGLGGTSFGNYTLGRPLVGGLVCGIILGDVATGILVGVAMQVVYIALVTPGGTVSADVRAVSYIGIPLAMIALKSYGLDAASSDGQSLATSFGTMVGTLGTVLFYGTATINLAWQHIGWKAVEKGNFKKLYPIIKNANLTEKETEEVLISWWMLEREDLIENYALALRKNNLEEIAKEDLSKESKQVEGISR